MKKQKAVIFDIDGVLAEKSPERDYREYDKVHLDKHNTEYFEKLIYSYAEKFYQKNGKWKREYHIIFITGRKEHCRELTEKWLGNGYYKHYKPICFADCLASCSDPISYFLGQRYKLFMRGDKDHRKAHELKREIYEKEVKDKYDVVACFDDDPEIIKMYQEYGLLTFQVGNRN